MEHETRAPRAPGSASEIHNANADIQTHVDSVSIDLIQLILSIQSLPELLSRKAPIKENSSPVTFGLV